MKFLFHTPDTYQILDRTGDCYLVREVHKMADGSEHEQWCTVQLDGAGLDPNLFRSKSFHDNLDEARQRFESNK